MKGQRLSRTNMGFFLLAFVVLADSLYANQPSWAVSTYDESLLVLRAMFGSVDGLLGGVDGLTALQFKIFNVSVMVFASIFVGSTITQGVVASAGQGVLMGKKQGQSAYFTIFRSSAGLLSVFPQYNGYSLIQVAVMSIILKSMSLAGELSSLILEQVMLDSPIEMFQQAQGSGVKFDAANKSLLSNEQVKSFYNSVFGMAVDSAIANRQKPDFAQKQFPQSLYKIESKGSDYVIKFEGVDEEIQLYGYGINSTILNERIKERISPIVSKVFNCWPQAAPADAGPRVCGEPDAMGPCGKTKSQLVESIIRQINAEHDLFSSLFVLPIIEGEGGRNYEIQGFANNWMMFPFLYQAALDVKSRGLNVKLEDLIKRAFPKDGSNELTAIDDVVSTKYTSLGGQKLAGTVTLPIVKFAEYSGEALVTESVELKSVVPLRVKPEVFGDTERNDSRKLVEGYLDHFSKAVHQPLSEEGSVYKSDPYRDRTDTIFNDNDAPELQVLWNAFNPRGDYSNNFFTSMHAERVAMRDPTDAFIRGTGNKWIETYIGKEGDPDIVKNPIDALTNLATTFSRDTLLFLMTMIRNVSAEQILNAEHTFWEFFAIKLFTKSAAQVTETLQEIYNDGTSCLIKNLIMPIGSSTRRPACNPMFLTLVPFPIFNPGFPAELIPNVIAQVVSTVANTAMQVGDDLASSYFALYYMYKTQFAYAYYSYILIAATPLMIVSNLLAIWVPMLPPLVFFIAVVGWLFAVIEAMIASPLVLLGMTFPQGHDFLGSAQQALILLLSVFIRAPLIVIGFFISMLILYISMMALGYAVVPIILSLFEGSSTIMLGDAFMMYAFMLIIMYVTTTLLSQTLALTYKLPNSIVAWIGGQQMEGVEAAAVQQLQGVVSQQQPFQAIQSAGLSGSSSAMDQKATTGTKSGANIA